MFAISEYARLDKQDLVGTCVKLPVSFETEKLIKDFNSISPDLWGSRGGRVGVHAQAEAVFLRGYAPAEGDLPIEDRPVLGTLPSAKQLIYQLFGASPLRCLFAKLKANGRVPLHIDNGEYFEKTIRIHLPIVTNTQAKMLVGGEEFSMQVGEAWAINNCTVHGVVNAHESEARTHLICDYLPSDNLLKLLSDGERALGVKTQ